MAGNRYCNVILSLTVATTLGIAVLMMTPAFMASGAATASTGATAAPGVGIGESGTYTVYLPLVSRAIPPVEAITVPLSFVYTAIVDADSITDALAARGSVVADRWYALYGAYPSLYRPLGDGVGTQVRREALFFDLPAGLTGVVSAQVEFDGSFYDPPEGQPNLPLLVSQSDVAPGDDGWTFFFGGNRGAEWEWMQELNRSASWCNRQRLAIPTDKVDWTRDWLVLFTRAGAEMRPDLWMEGAVYVHRLEWWRDLCPDNRVPTLTIWVRR